MVAVWDFTSLPIKEWLDKRAIMYPRIINVLKQGIKLVAVSVHWKRDRLVTY